MPVYISCKLVDNAGRVGMKYEYEVIQKKKYMEHWIKIDKKNLKKEIDDIHEILVKAMPDSWMHLAVPSISDIYAEVKTLMPFVDESLIHIARAGNKPIGFVAAIPDYNQDLSKMK